MRLLKGTCFGVFATGLSIGLAAAALIALQASATPPAGEGKSAHDFRFDAIAGGDLDMQDYAGKAVLVVNTASFCGFTGQYEGLQALWERYRDRGLVVLGVPSNDFGNQEPGTETEIQEFCEMNFAVTFPMTAKYAVRGTEAHPFYRWARQEMGAGKAPRWNFHKYLIGPDGRLAGSFASTVEPTAPELVAAIEAALPG